MKEGKEECPKGGEHEWVCSRAGMFVSHYVCRKCNKEDLRSG